MKLVLRKMFDIFNSFSESNGTNHHLFMKLDRLKLLTKDSSFEGKTSRAKYNSDH